MISYRIEQRRLRYRNGDLCFVTYRTLTDETCAGDEGPPDTWFLMRDGRRFAVMPQDPSRSGPELDRALLGWVEDNVDIVSTGSATWESAGAIFKRS